MTHFATLIFTKPKEIGPIPTIRFHISEQIFKKLIFGYVVHMGLTDHQKKVPRIIKSQGLLTDGSSSKEIVILLPLKSDYIIFYGKTKLFF